MTVQDRPATESAPIDLAARVVLSVELARSWLLLPGSAVDRFDSAAVGAADALVLDLEDGVADADKPAARRHVAGWLAAGNRAWVRISAVGTPEWHEDIEVLRAIPADAGLDGVMVAVSETAAQIHDTVTAFGREIPVVALVETALGIENAGAIAAAPGVVRIAFGTNDFRRDTFVSNELGTMAYARSRLVIASRAYGLPSPIDGPPAPGLGAQQILESVDASKRYGLLGRLCLSDAHAQATNVGMRASAAEVHAAKTFIKEAESTAGEVNGSYRPRLLQARELLARDAQYQRADGA